MAGHETAVIVAKVLTIITTLLMLLYTNSYALLYYSYVIDDMLPLFATSVLGVAVGGILAFFFYRWTDYKQARSSSALWSSACW
jgi:hypothetical protein